MNRGKKVTYAKMKGPPTVSPKGQKLQGRKDYEGGVGGGDL